LKNTSTIIVNEARSGCPNGAGTYLTGFKMKHQNQLALALLFDYKETGH